MWERSFIAASVLTGGTADEAAAMLEPEAAARAADLLAALGHPQRAVRARALAVVGQEIARAIDEVTLR